MTKSVSLKKYRVPNSAITEKGLRRLLQSQVNEVVSMSSWSKDNSLTPQAVSAFIRKVQGAGLGIPEALGYKPQLVYIPLDDEDIQEKPAPRRPAQNHTSKVDPSKGYVEKQKGAVNTVGKDEVKKALRRRMRKG